jgi:hypothetical protein
VRDSNVRGLVEVAEVLDVPRTAREVQEMLGIAPASVYRRLLNLAALGRTEIADLVRVGRCGAGALRWRRTR